MCTQNNHISNHNGCRQNHTCSNQLILSKKKKMEMLNNCLKCTQEKEADIREAIKELSE